MPKHKPPGGPKHSSGRAPGRTPQRTKAGGRPQGDRPREGRPHGERPRGDRPHSDRAHSDRPRSDRPRGDRPQGDRPHGNKPNSSRPQSDRPQSTRPQNTRPENKRPHIGRPPERAQERPKPPRPQIDHPRPAPFLHPAPQVGAGDPLVGRSRRTTESWIYGHHPVAAVLANTDRKVLRVLATTEALAKLNADTSIPPRTLLQVKAASRREIDDLVGEDAVHQGVAVLTHALEHDLQDMLELIAVNPKACIVVLDQVTDPHNVGAILRSAAAFGAAAVVAPDRHAPDESGVMAKSASGALDKIPYIKSGNLVRALELVKEYQFWLVGLDADAPQQLSDIKLDGRIALVLGAEGEGLRRLVRETCDHVASLAMAGNIESLNVSNATAVALYERARQLSSASKAKR
jgi:23S rRNA (guanosine2251-2'-O)-methyltransferase